MFIIKSKNYFNEFTIENLDNITFQIIRNEDTYLIEPGFVDISGHGWPLCKPFSDNFEDNVIDTLPQGFCGRISMLKSFYLNVKDKLNIDYLEFRTIFCNHIREIMKN